MDEYVEICYKGKDYIGQILSIESEGRIIHSFQMKEYFISHYKVCIREKDTLCKIDDIIIQSLNEIKLYDGE